MSEKNNETELAIINLEYELPKISKLTRQPTQLKIDYDLLAKLCAIGCPLSECAFALGTTSRVLDIKIRQDKKMTFKEFSGYYESFQNISARRKLLKKALVDEHWGALQWVSINQLGMSKDGMMKADDEDNSTYTTKELIEMLKETKDDGSKREKKSNEQCESSAGERIVLRKPGDPDSPVHISPKPRSTSTGRSSSDGGQEEKGV